MTANPVPPAARKVPLHNPANVLTALRLVLIPVFVALVVASEMHDSGWQRVACITFCVASFTDFVDGWIARRFELVTSFGKVADPIADKALTGTALVLLSLYGQLSWWVTGLILIREWGITLLRFWVLRYGVIPASRGGKLKTALQTAALAWYLWPVPAPYDGIGKWIMALALGVTVLTGIDYLAQAVRLRRAPIAPGRPAQPGSPLAGGASGGGLGGASGVGGLGVGGASGGGLGGGSNAALGGGEPGGAPRAEGAPR